MRSAVDLYEDLKRKYSGTLPFKRICEDEKIVVVKTRLPEGVHSFYATSNGHRVIVLSAAITHNERRDRAWHEIYHHFRSVPGAASHHNKREEQNADLFASICRAPIVREGDAEDSLMERTGISRKLARLRISVEQRRGGI